MKIMIHSFPVAPLIVVLASAGFLSGYTQSPAAPPPALQATPPPEVPVHKQTTEHVLQFGPRGQGQRGSLSAG